MPSERNAAILVPKIKFAAGGTSFVAQGGPIPVRAFSFAGGVLLTPHKMATATVFTRELFSYSTPTIEAIMRQTLYAGVDLDLAAAMFSTFAGDSTTPPGLLAGVTASATSVLGSSLEAMLADVGTVVGAVAPVAENAEIVLVADPVHAARLRTWRDRVPFEVLASGALTNRLIAVASNAICSAVDPQPRFAFSADAALVMNDVPAAVSTVGTPNVAAAPISSLYQQDLIGLRLVLELDFKLRDPGGIAYLAVATAW